MLLECTPLQVITEAKRQNLLRFARLQDQIELHQATSGRVFQRDRELRWEKEGDHYRVVYLGAGDIYAAGLTRDDIIQKLKKRDHPKSYYLFGELLELDDNKRQLMGIEDQNTYYAEVRIPRLLRYPQLEGSPRRLQLVVCEYIEEKTEQVQLFRFQDLKPEKDA